MLKRKLVSDKALRMFYSFTRLFTDSILIIPIFVSLLQILVAFVLTPNELMPAFGAPIKTKGCSGQLIEIKHPKKKLEEILKHYMVIVNWPPSSLTHDDVYPMKPSARCPFRVEISRPVNQRIPKFLPRATCKRCPPKCKPVGVKKTVLKRKCVPGLGTVYSFIEETVVIGFVYER